MAVENATSVVDAALRGLGDLSNRVSAALDADLLVYDGGVNSTCDGFMFRTLGKRKRRPNVLLIIHTHGGSADAAYRFARGLQRKYKRFSIYLGGHCKSAGTIMAIGAHELIIPDEGELGPLDVQLNKPDEIGEAISGLTLSNALTVLKAQAYDLWEYMFLNIKNGSDGQITTKTASEIAANLAGHLFAPVYAQIDPNRIGETERAVRISVEYGERLNRQSQNLKPDALSKLVTEYASHEFVIDREEASGLFRAVREPTDDEAELAEMVEDVVYPLLQTPPVAFLDDILATLGVKSEERHEPRTKRANRAPTKATRQKVRRTNGTAAQGRSRNGRVAVG